MATRSSITAKCADGKFRSVYCHWDGYLSHNGRILLDNYNTQEKIEALLSHGDISSLSARCEKPEGHTFDTPVKGYTVYYGRDRGEIDTEVRVGDSFEEANDGNSQEYDYRWDGEIWTVSFDSGSFIDLKTAVENKADE